MRLIDAYDLGKRLHEMALDEWNQRVATSWSDAFLECENMVYDTQPVNAVKVVRCRDCKWWDEDDNGLYGYCMAMKHGYMSANLEIGIYRKYKGDFYCADGERREDVQEPD